MTALAMGLSLNQTLILLAILSGAATAPRRSQVHRWVQAAGMAAGAVLKRLDHSARTLGLVGCLDEILFHRRPVLVGVEPRDAEGGGRTDAGPHSGAPNRSDFFG